MIHLPSVLLGLFPVAFAIIFGESNSIYRGERTTANNHCETHVQCHSRALSVCCIYLHLPPQLPKRRITVGFLIKLQKNDHVFWIVSFGQLSRCWTTTMTLVSRHIALPPAAEWTKRLGKSRGAEVDDFCLGEWFSMSCCWKFPETPQKPPPNKITKVTIQEVLNTLRCFFFQVLE